MVTGVSSFFKKVWDKLTKSTYAIIGSYDEEKVWLEFDSIDECTTTGSSTVTKYPTEYGMQATDYKYKNPDTVTMVGVISEGGLLGINSFSPRMGSWNKDNVLEIIRTNLNTLVNQMTLVDIQTRNAGLRKFMTLTNYTVNESYDTYGLLEVQMTFQEVVQFTKDGELVRDVADSDTENAGIATTTEN